MELIVACDQKMGIGLNGRLPWHDQEELSLFREKTQNSVLIVGRKTAEGLPVLANRVVLVLTDTGNFVCKDGQYRFKTMFEALKFAKEVYPAKKIFIAGGEAVYYYCLTVFTEDIRKIHISVMNGVYHCDSFLRGLTLSDWVIDSEKKYGTFTHGILLRKDNGEKTYLNLLSEVLKTGNVQVGRNGPTRSLFFRTLQFDLRDGFPLLTTKKMFFRGIVEELLFFLRGETDTKKLEQLGVNIWKGNTSRSFLDNLGMTERTEGVMGPMYGYQWRFFGAEYDEKSAGKKEGTAGVDQLLYVVNTIRKDPHSRRIIMTDFNPAQADLGVLYPCHSIVTQFYVGPGDTLEMSCYNRSQDLFLGTPFNIASSALLLSIIAKLTGKTPTKLHMILGDVHIYETHIEAVETQLKRQRYSFPSLKVEKELDLSSIQASDFTLENYSCHPAIKAEMVS